MKYYVSITGNDSTGDGTQSSPWRTIGHAIEQINNSGNDGDEIIVLDGTYDESGNSKTIQKNISIVANNTLQSKIYFDGYSTSTLWTVTGKIIKLQGFIVNGINGGTLFNLSGGATILINFCYLYGNIVVFNMGGISNAKCYNCTLRGVTKLMQLPTTGFSAGDMVLKLRNTIVSSVTTFSSNNNFTIYEDHNCFYDVSLPFTIDSSSLFTDPKFSNPSGSDNSYLLQSSSPCVDAGVPMGTYRETYYGSAPDIGCYEYPGGTSSRLLGETRYTRVYFGDTQIGDYAWVEISFEGNPTIRTIPRLVGSKIYSIAEMGGGHYRITVHAWIRKQSRRDVEIYFLELPQALGFSAKTLKFDNVTIRDCVLQGISADSEYNNWAFFEVSFVAPIQT